MGRVLYYFDPIKKIELEKEMDYVRSFFEEEFSEFSVSLHGYNEYMDFILEKLHEQLKDALSKFSKG